MGDTKEIRIHIVLKAGGVVTFVHVVEVDKDGVVVDASRELFGDVIEDFGRSAWVGELIVGIDEHGDRVAIPGENVAYVRGAGI